MSKVPTLEDCGIVAGSFGVKPDICDGGKLTVTSERGNPITVAEFEDEDDCRLVAHRCNTFDAMLAVLQMFVDVNQRQGYEFESNEPGLYRAIQDCIAAAKGATP